MCAYYYFLNRGGSGDGFKELLNGGIFVDKTRLIEETNKRISTKEKWICVSRLAGLARQWHWKCWQHTIQRDFLQKPYSADWQQKTVRLFTNI